METKYKKYYDDLIVKAKNRSLIDCYFESHHIVPRCLGGIDIEDNLVNLTAREHYVAHLLLVKIYPNDYGLIKAANMMCVFSETNNERILNRRYSWIKEKLSLAMSISQSGENNSQYGTMWVSNLDKKISKKIKKYELDLYLNNDFVVGRNVWLKKSKNDLKQDRDQIRLNKYKNTNVDKFNSIIEKRRTRSYRLANVDSIHTHLLEYGYKETQDKFGFNNGASLCNFLKKYCPEFVKKQGVKR